MGDLTITNLRALRPGVMSKNSSNPIDKYVGSRVQMRWMMLGISQENLGDALGLTFQQVQKYEKGANRIGASQLQHIAHILQVPVTFFFEGTPGYSKAECVRRAIRCEVAAPGG